MERGRPYNLRMSRKQSLSPPPSSPDSSPPPSPPDSPPPPPPSSRPRYRRQRSKRRTVCSPRSQLHSAFPSPTTDHEASVLQLPPPPPPPPAAGFSEEVPIDISSEEEDQKSKIADPLFRLKPPPPIVRQNASTMFVEKSVGITERVKSLLVSELLALPNSEITTMISKANRAFTALDCYGDDYISFYWTVRRFIHFSQELLVAETLRTARCAVLEEVTRRYEEAVIEANEAEEALYSAETKLVKAKDKVASLTQRLKEARNLVVRLEMELDLEESEAVAWEREVGKLSVCHSSVEAKVQRVHLEEEVAKNLVYEVNKKWEEAISGIELMKNSFH